MATTHRRMKIRRMKIANLTAERASLPLCRFSRAMGPWPYSANGASDMRRQFAAILAGAVVAVIVIYALFDERIHVRSLFTTGQHFSQTDRPTSEN